jgi:hypothetical protein
MVNKFQPNDIMCLSAICLIIVMRAFESLITLMQLSHLVAFDHRLCKENEDISNGAAHSGGRQQRHF